MVDDQQGQSLRVELLSRGTREQLFLALRLALVGSYARRGVRLPLVLDDVLVNFDAPRAKAAALVLRDFARAGHQLLIFTCHEHIAQAVQAPEGRSAPVARQRACRSVGGRVHAAQAATESGRNRSKNPLWRRCPRKSRSTPTRYDEVEPELPPAWFEPPEPQPVARPEPLPARIVEPRPAPRIERRVSRVEWSAEEFDGELADRVRRPARSPRESTSPSDVANDDEDAEAA